MFVVRVVCSVMRGLCIVFDVCGVCVVVSGVSRVCRVLCVSCCVLCVALCVLLCVLSCVLV